MTSDKCHSSETYGMVGNSKAQFGIGMYQAIPMTGVPERLSPFGARMKLLAWRRQMKKKYKRSPRVLQLIAIARRREFLLTGR